MMRRGRGYLALLCLLLPVALWGLSGWSLPLNTSAQAAGPADLLPPNPIIQGMIDQVTQAEWIDLAGGLSGQRPVTVGGSPVTFVTRYTPSSQGTLAEQYVYEYFQSLGLATSYHSWTRCGITARNVVAEIPGTLDPTRQYLLTAHVDTISPQPTTNAKGADDDGSGVAAAMIAARIMKNYSFDYTLKFVAFTGEERGLCGSGAYAADARARNDNIQGVINFDMIAYDSNNVNDVEIHSGTRADSNVIADSLIASIATYNLDLIPNRYTNGATTASDHASFWAQQYPAILGSERYFGGDFNPWYHSYTCCDDMSHTDPVMAAEFTKAGMATLAVQAGVHAGGQATPTGTPAPPTETPGTPTATSTPCKEGACPTSTPVPATRTNTPIPTPAPSSPTPTPTTTATPCTINFSDVQTTDYFYEAVRSMVCGGIVSGYSDNTFRPYRNLTRAQAVKMVVLSYGWPLLDPEAPAFTDVPRRHWAYQYIETVHSREVIAGYLDQTFKPNNPITRGQLAKIIVSSSGWALIYPPDPTFVDVPRNDTFYHYVETAYLHGILRGYSDWTFHPYSNTTRGQLAKVLFQARQQ